MSAGHKSGCHLILQNIDPPAQPPLPVTTPSGNRQFIAGFWRRIGAALLDGLLIGAVGFVLGQLFSEQFMRMGGWARLVGAVVALLYYAPLNSRVGNGHTIGKRALHIRVAGADGQPISMGRSLVRSSVLLLPFFFNGAPVNSRMLNPLVSWLFSIAVFGMGGAIIYLFIFNRRTRQSLHDLVVGSYVTRDGEEGSLPRMWKGHYVVVSLILVIAAVAPEILARIVDRTSIGELLPTYRTMLDEPEVTSAQVMQGTSFFWDPKNGNKRRTTYVTASVRLNQHPADRDAEAKKLAQIILETDPAAEQRDVINVVLVEGWDIGIASRFHSQPYALSPLQWRVQLSRNRAP